MWRCAPCRSHAPQPPYSRYLDLVGHRSLRAGVLAPLPTPAEMLELLNLAHQLSVPAAFIVMHTHDVVMRSNRE